MSNTTKLLKAKLIELTAELEEKPGGKETTVQFNPESLKVSFANQVVQPNNAGSGGSGDQSSTAARQFVGAGTTKLALTLWFDVGAQDTDSGDAKADVRDLTKDVAFFITPKQDGDHYVPPGVRFLWGSFQFDGLVDSLEETLEFFSDEGVPLRANISLGLSQQRISEFHGNQKALAANPSPPGAFGAGSGDSIGTTPLVQVKAGASLQATLGSSKSGASWQSIAEANGIENPRQLNTGAMLNLKVRK
jgi:hypothetical protein